MSKGEVPISYIIALILGIVVVAVLGYWFFVMQSSGGSEMTLDQCKSKAYTYCSMWRDNGYAYDETSSDKPPDLGLINGGLMYFSSMDGDVGAYAASCSSYSVLKGTDYDNLKDDCETILGG